MPLPLAHGLAGASIVAALSENFSLRRDWWKLGIGAAIAVIPDLDLLLSWGLGYSMKIHGGFTHSLVFGIAIGSIVSLIFREEAVKGVIGYICAVMSHGLLDSFTKKDFGGSQLLWPFSAVRYRLGVFNDYEFYPNPASQSISQIVRDSMRFLGYELLIYLPILLLIVFIRLRKGAANRGSDVE